MPLHKDFYGDVELFIEKLSDPTNPEMATIKANIIKISNDIFNRRKQKVLLYVAYKRPLPSQSPAIESRIYESISETMNCGLEGKINAVTEQAMEVLDNIPEVMMPNGSKIGPLSKGQRISITNNEEAKFLVEAGICKKL